MRWRTGAVLAAAAYLAVHRLGRSWGSTREERREGLPGDDIVPAAHVVTDHGRTIAAPPSQVWPWLTQVGWHLGGWYTPRWVDRLLFPDNWPSLDRLDPRLVRELAVGDAVPDGPPDTAWFVVAQVRVPEVLVLHSTTHVPASWRRSLGASIDWSWAFVLRPIPGGRTRLHLRVRGRLSPWWLRWAYRAAIVPADLVMAAGMLRGIDARVRAALPAEVSGREPLGPQ